MKKLLVSSRRKFIEESAGRISVGGRFLWTSRNPAPSINPNQENGVGSYFESVFASSSIAFWSAFNSLASTF